MSNKSIGASFERAFADILAQHGFWVHIFQDNRNGQPCDIIVARNGHTDLFDCKNCEKDYFLLSRMEENQYNAMSLFELTGNRRGMFAVMFSDCEIYLIPYWHLKVLRDNGVKRLTRIQCCQYGTELQTWLSKKNQDDDWRIRDADHNRQRDPSEGCDQAPSGVVQ